MKYLWMALYIGCIFGANWALNRWGIVSIGFGLMAPAGVFFAGVTFTARDMIRESWGRIPVIFAILIGGVVSWWVEDIPKIALASGAAFLFSESMDGLVYEPLRKWWLPAVVVSNLVGVVLDSALFLWVAFGSLDYIDGLIVGKAYMTLLAIPILWGIKSDLSQRLYHRFTG